MNKFGNFLSQFINGFFTFFGMFSIVVLVMADGFAKAMHTIGEVLMVYIGLILTVVVLLALIVLIWGTFCGIKEYIKKRGC